MCDRAHLSGVRRALGSCQERSVRSQPRKHPPASRGCGSAVGGRTYWKEKCIIVGDLLRRLPDS